MKPQKIKENIFWVGAVDWDRRLFDSLIQLPDGTSYNSYLVYGKDKTAIFDTVDPSKTDIGKLTISLMDAATIVVGSPTVLAGAHPLVVSAVFLANALRPKLKFASIIGSYGWAGKMTEQIKSLMSNLSVELLEGVVIKGMPKDKDYSELDRLANDILNKHRGINIG